MGSVTFKCNKSNFYARFYLSHCDFTAIFPSALLMSCLTETRSSQRWMNSSAPNSSSAQSLGETTQVFSVP